MNLPKLKKGEALILRTCKEDMTAHSDFKWPKKGKVTAPDWKPTAECGNGLHGLLWGEGDGSNLCFDEKAVWMVCKVKESECVNIDRKVKFPSCEVIYAGTRENATQLIHLVRPNAVIEGLILTGGDYATMTGGDYATMTGGYSATMTGGDYATMTGGDYATMTGGYSATMTGGNYAVLQFTYWDGKRQRVVIAYVGEDGIKANVPYKLDDNHKPVEIKP